MFFKFESRNCLAVCLVVILLAMLPEAKGKKCCKESKDSVLLLTKLNKGSNSASSSSGDIHRRSLAPWTWKLNEDETRIPRVIPEAVCKFKWCVNSIGDKDQKLNSVEIQQEMYVLKLKLNATGGGKGCRQDIYTVETMMITVGCTCVNPIIMES